jgi:AcrR family transcriptional regulator
MSEERMETEQGEPPVSKVRVAATRSTTVGARETTRRARTRERLLDAAYRQFCENGINGTSIEAITDDAGFTRGAFYSNFASKEELFLALIERENQARLDNLQDAFGNVMAPLAHAGGKPGPKLIEKVLADLFALQPEGRQWSLLNTEFRLLAMRDPQVAPQYLESMHAFQHRLTALVDAELDSVGLRFVVDSDLLTRTLIYHFESAMHEAILSGVKDPDRVARKTIMRTLPPLVHSLTELEHPEE